MKANWDSLNIAWMCCCGPRVWFIKHYSAVCLYLAWPSQWLPFAKWIFALIGYGCFKLAELFVLRRCMLIGWDGMRFFGLAINAVQNSTNLPWQSIIALTRVWIFRLFAPSSAYLGKSRQHKEVSSCRTCDFGLFPRIKLLSEMLFLCTQTHTRRRTLSLASLLIAQEILSAGGQLQAH